MYHVVRHDSAKDTSGWYGEPSIKTITIVPLDKTYDLDEADPMAVSALLYVVLPRLTHTSLTPGPLTAFRKTSRL